jgi:phospholipid transport system substrate-binding protein
MKMIDHSPVVSRRRLLRVGAALVPLVALPALGSGVAHAAEAPEALIEKLGKELIANIRSDKAIQGGDIAKLSELVDRLVMPHVNFQRMTSLAAGRWWRQASPEQRDALMTEFRTLLLRTYAGALAAVDDQTIRMRPTRGVTDTADVIVRSEIVQPRGEPIQLDYRMQKTENGWKIYDVNVLGVWLVETYRTQFNQEAAKSGVDGLIKSLAEKNRSSQAGKRS